jgi:hypothetical protein
MCRSRGSFGAIRVSWSGALILVAATRVERGSRVEPHIRNPASPNSAARWTEAHLCSTARTRIDIRQGASRERLENDS